MPPPRSKIKRNRLPVSQFTPAVKNRFAEEFLLDCDASAAAERVGFPHCGSQLLGLPEVQTRLRVLRMRAQSHTEIYSDAVLKRWWQLSSADARELTGIYLVNCRHCRGFDHRYQWTANGLRVARHRHSVLGELWDYSSPSMHPEGRYVRQLTAEEKGRPFDDLGGEGFDPWGDPVDSCTECGGIGVPKVWVADTRKLSPSAALLYDGVEINGNNIRVRQRDRNFADQKVAEALGMTIRNREPPLPLDPVRMSDEQLDAAIEAFERAGLLDADEALELAEDAK